MRDMKLKSIAAAMLAVATLFGCPTFAVAQVKSPGKAQTKAECKPAAPGKHDDCAVPYTIKVSGLDCEGCMETIKTGLTKVTGVEEVKTNFKSKSVTVWICPHKNVKQSSLTAAIKKSGFKVKSIRQGKA
jgi:copper chaperone CopZ